MNYLIQNTSNAPVYFPVIRMRDGKPSSEGSVFFEAGQITKVSDEIYTQLIKHPFYKGKIERGELIVLNAGSSAAETAVNASIQARELDYARYVSLVKSIQASGGLSEPRLRPFLDEQGMPDLQLCRKNLGDTVDPTILAEYRSRYLAEKENGMHEPRIVIPTGGSMPTKADVKLEQERPEEAVQEEASEPALETLSMEALKQKADELGVEYAEDMSFTRLLNRVRKAMK